MPLVYYNTTEDKSTCGAQVVSGFITVPAGLKIVRAMPPDAVSQAAPARKPSQDPLRTLHNREVPQEDSHYTSLANVRTSLALDNPDNIQDPVFSLLGNGAAAAGQGSITDTDCLHQATADQAFTNAKAAGVVDSMTNASIYSSLERNTGKVGLASVLCTAIKATNPEIAAISQHQDSASPRAAATNKAITLELARQIAFVIGHPQAALKSGTFAPREVDDPTAAGKSCNNLDDEPGCIFTQNLLVEDATAGEINTAVADTKTPAGSVVSETSTLSAAVSIGTGSAFLNSEEMSGEHAPFSNKTASATSSSEAQEEACKEQKLHGLDGRKEASFAPNSDADFKHGSSLNIGVMSAFICQQLNDKCKAGAEAVAACEEGKEAAANAKGQDAADAFNAALGGEGVRAVEEDVADESDEAAEIDVTCNTSSSTTSAAAASSSTSAATASNAEHDEAAPSSVPSAAANSDDHTNDTEANQDIAANSVQQYQRCRKRATTITANDKTDTFIRKGTALSRSCAVQNNACANAADSGKIEGGVGQCDEQKKECKAASGA
ncbi:MAG: hypothetical protein L6R42_004106 [Xanthoria sp. 1 TBL-2021]|nr:MAG: hypothetical protein L6R42_004106 [Xanthoria sp. 1 TBL-2021]